MTYYSLHSTHTYIYTHTLHLHMQSIVVVYHHAADPELDGHSFIAVYDGHGGQYSAIYCGKHMIEFVKNTKGFQEYKK